MAAVEPDYEGLVSELMPLRQLSPGSQAQILNAAEILRFPPDAFVFREGDSDPWSFYLLEGALELVSDGQTIRRLSGGGADAVHPLAQLQPRKMSARAESEVAVLKVDRRLLEKLVAADIGDAGDAFEVAEIETEANDDWMTRMLQSKLFANLPASNIHRIFSMLETVAVAAGDVIVRQDDAGDYYYVIVNGRAEITRAAAPGAPGYRLALIGPGDAFGEEALVGDARRNASVQMITDGELVRLEKAHFVDLIKKPLLSAITLDEARDVAAARGAQWLDVRFPEEHAAGALPDSINHPLNTLRMHSGRLAADRTYIVYCDNGRRSAIAAFLLAERGFDVHFLEGGLQAYGPAPDAATSSVDLTLHDDESSEPAAPAVAPVPTSHRSDSECEPDAVVAAAALSVEVEVSDLELAARSERASAAAADDEAQARAAAERAAELERAVEEAREAAHREAEERVAAERERAQAELDAARRKAEQEAALRLKAERHKLERQAQLARRELDEARRVKQDLERARADAEARVEQERREQASRVEQVRAEMERRLRDEERKLKESYQWQADELKRLQEQKRTAEARLAEEQQRVQAQSKEARARLAQAREWQKRLEEVQQASAAEAAQREQERLALEQRLREELKHKVQSERSKLEQELARNAAELKRAIDERQAAEAARAAAADEAQEIIAEFKQAHARKRMQEEAEMQVERERLEADSRRLRLALELAQREKDAALDHQRRIEEEMQALRESPAQAPDVDNNLESLRAEAAAAAAEVEKTEQARADAQAAAVASAGDLAAHKVHEQQVRNDLAEELDQWLDEQKALENSDVQRAVLANQKAHIERIKQRAEAARHAAKAHDQALIDELAAHFHESNAD